jgi:hypothetical protein
MPKCRECKEKFEQYEFNNKFCKKIDCQTAKAMDYLDKRKKKQNKTGKKRKRKFDLLHIPRRIKHICKLK